MLQVLHWHDLQWVKCRVWDHTHPKLGGAFTTGKLGGFGVKPNKSISTAADAQHEGVHLFHTKNAFIQQASKLCQKNPNMKVKNVRLRDQGSFNERLARGACLLAVIFYPEAHLVFHTDRTRFAASEGQGWDEFMALPKRFS
jgi:hypothetical protein